MIRVLSGFVFVGFALVLFAITPAHAKDTRQTYKQFAHAEGIALNDLFRTLGGSGRLRCPWGTASAQVVEHPQVIITNRHVIADKKGRIRSNIGACVFQYESGQTTAKVGVLGHSYVHGGSEASARKLIDDWAVLRLQTPVRFVQPYRILSVTALKAGGQDIVLVAQGHDNWDDYTKATRSIARCSLSDSSVLYGGGLHVVGSDCHSGRGSSGGAIGRLTKGRQFRITALHTAGVPENRIQRGIRGLDIAIEGKFLAAVMAMAHGVDMKQTQLALTERGFHPGKADGIPGRRTFAALEAFRKDRGIPQTATYYSVLKALGVVGSYQRPTLFDATGWLVCGGRGVSAHLVGDQRTIIFTPIPFDQDSKFAECTFNLRRDNKWWAYRMEAGSLIEDNQENPRKLWAVARLRRPVTVGTAYQLETQFRPGTYGPRQNRHVAAVGHPLVVNPDTGKKRISFPRGANCSILAWDQKRVEMRDTGVIVLRCAPKTFVQGQAWGRIENGSAFILSGLYSDPIPEENGVGVPMGMFPSGILVNGAFQAAVAKSVARSQP